MKKFLLQESQQTRNAEIKTKRAFGYKTACWTYKEKRMKQGAETTYVS